MLILTSSFRLLTSKTDAIDNPGAAKPRKPGAVWASGKLLSPGTPATPPANGEANGELRLCTNGLESTPGAPARIESTEILNVKKSLTKPIDIYTIF